MNKKQSNVDTIEPDFLFWKNEVLIPCLKDYYKVSQVPEMDSGDFSNLRRAFATKSNFDLVRLLKYRNKHISVLLPNYVLLSFSISGEKSNKRLIKSENLDPLSVNPIVLDFYVMTEEEYEKFGNLLTKDRIYLKRDKFNEYTNKVRFLSKEKITAIYIYDFELIKQAV